MAKSKPNPEQGSEAGVSLVALGDLLITKSVQEFISSKDKSYRAILSTLRGADVTLGNLEVSLTTTGFPAEKLVTLRADPALTPEIREMGIDVLSLANNHMMDYGYAGLFETMKALKENGIPYVGAGKNLQDALTPFVYRKNGIQISFLGVSTCLALGAEAADARPGVAPVRVSTAYEIDPTTLQEQPGTSPVVRTAVRKEDLKILSQAIRNAKARSNYVVVAIHWGVAYQDQLAEYQRPLAHAMIDAGADLIMGHHAHVPHAIEIYKKGIVFYGLGNFIMRYERLGRVAEYLHTIGIDMKQSNSNETFMVRFTWGPKRNPVCEIIPLVIDQHGLPRQANRSTGQRIVQKLNRLSHGMSRVKLRGRAGYLDLTRSK